jgi:O-acetyl-ADP-ribose deacetylase (regulator of RNase III)
MNQQHHCQYAVCNHYPVDLLNTPFNDLLNELMYWRDLNSRSETRIDQERATLQRIMTDDPPLPPLHLRRAKVTEVTVGNLFNDAPRGAALAHCVGADFMMGAGLAVEFLERFGHVQELRAMHLQPGQVATMCLLQPNSLEVDRYVFHLVTKPTSHNCLPRWWELIYAVRELRRLCEHLAVKVVAMPQIGTGLDRQHWWKVRRVIDIEFAGSDTEVLVFHHPSELPRTVCGGQSIVEAAAPAATLANETWPQLVPPKTPALHVHQERAKTTPSRTSSNPSTS